VFASSEHIRQHLPGVVINGVPEPARMCFRLHKTPHLVELRAEPTTHLQLIRAPDFHLNLLGMQEREHPVMHWLQLRLFFPRAAKSRGGTLPPASQDTIRDHGGSADAGSVAGGESPVPAATLARH